jgi:hypothetical protein
LQCGAFCIGLHFRSKYRGYLTFNGDGRSGLMRALNGAGGFNYRLLYWRLIRKWPNVGKCWVSDQHLLRIRSCFECSRDPKLFRIRCPELGSLFLRRSYNWLLPVTFGAPRWDAASTARACSRVAMYYNAATPPAYIRLLISYMSLWPWAVS